METKISMAEKVAEKCMEKVLLILECDHVPDQDAIRTISDLVRIKRGKIDPAQYRIFPRMKQAPLSIRSEGGQAKATCRSMEFAVEEAAALHQTAERDGLRV